MPAALLDTLAAQPPVVRALLAAGPLWELTDDEVEHLAGAGGRDVDLGPARRALVATHREARAGDGSGAADHLVAADLAALAQRLTSGQPDPPDPASLVEDRVRHVRRRSLAVAGGLGRRPRAARVGGGGPGERARPPGATGGVTDHGRPGRPRLGEHPPLAGARHPGVRPGRP